MTCKSPTPRRAAAVLAASALGLAAFAPEQADWAKANEARWTMSGVSEGDPVCGIDLGSEMVIGGAVAEVTATCRRNYPLEDVAGWALSGTSIRLIDPLRKTVLTLKPAAEGSYMGSFPDGRAVTLERGPPEAPTSLREMFDEETFTLSGPNNAGACGFAITVVSATRGRLEQAGRCAAPWKGRGWSSWAYEAGELRLKDAKGATILALKRADEYTFIADRPSGPVFFGPGVIDGSETPSRRGAR